MQAQAKRRTTQFCAQARDNALLNPCQCAFKHMKELEHVLKRVNWIDAQGNTQKLTERQYAVARAIAEFTKDADAGVQLAISKIEEGSFKKRATIAVALAELIELRVIHRSRGAPHDTHIFRFNQLLIEESAKSRPYLGQAILMPPQCPNIATICETISAGGGMDSKHLANSDLQGLDIQNLGGNYRCDTPPAPQRAEEGTGSLPASRGGLLPDQRAGGCVKEIQWAGPSFSPDLFGLTHFEKFSANAFFEWLRKNGVAQVCLDGMPRKKDGQRGAGVAQYFGFRYPVRTELAIQEFVRFGSKLATKKKNRVDLQMRSAEQALGLSRSILIDDLDASGVKALKAICRAEGAVLETSPDNFQVVLVWHELLSRDQRLALQRHFAAGVGGDMGAVSSIQLHRFPGSPNFKNDGLFVTRLTEYFTGTGSELDVMAELPCTSYKPNTNSVTERQADDHLDNSAAAMSWTLKELRKGTKHSEILGELGGRWLKHHHQIDWPQRTLKKALVYMSQRLRTDHRNSHPT
jgi:hypothetical protein